MRITSLQLKTAHRQLAVRRRVPEERPENSPAFQRRVRSGLGSSHEGTAEPLPQIPPVVFDAMILEQCQELYLAGTVRCIWKTDFGWLCEPATLGSFSLPALPDAVIDSFVARVSAPSGVAVEVKIDKAGSGFALPWPASFTGFLLE